MPFVALFYFYIKLETLLRNNEVEHFTIEVSRSEKCLVSAPFGRYSVE